ncbi:hypothetical protein Poli38472_001240 [Pythium oligandrum]|uniref:Uncharacterized protein n=1 Tax=Pythium oligandrum TaxID=41045 RepID=A0A8K1CT51_PYTOL|nr:hypothetical protein Poli38472_001240 [Pythium oligandrum]|eukprot:TMW69084.1 hypothetical protein Poli38472_001240 [Pythium oligandrum]
MLMQRVLSNARRAGAVTTRTARLRAACALRHSSDKPVSALGLKDASKANDFSPTTKMIMGYITFGLAAMVAIARAKERDHEVEESARVYNLAKRAVVKDRRFFEAIGYPKEFEKIESAENEGYSSSPSGAEVFEGSFRVIGDKGVAIVSYKHGVVESSEETSEDSEKSDATPAFERLSVQLEDGSEFSALESYASTDTAARQQKATSLGQKLLFPVVGGVLIGGISSFLLIRIIRNRPFYVHKLVLDHVNNSTNARTLLGHPIKSNRKDYVGSLTDEAANYTIACQGPKGEGTLIVKAYKSAPVEDSQLTAGVMATPGTDWKFSTLVLSVKRNEKRKEKDKTAKTIDLLAEHQS